jgi:hypothetical protein
MANMLEDLWQNMWEAKAKKAQDNLARRMSKYEFAGQHTNPARQSKNRMMKALHIKTGKAFRKYIKGVRAEERGGI